MRVFIARGNYSTLEEGGKEGGGRERRREGEKNEGRKGRRARRKKDGRE